MTATTTRATRTSVTLSVNGQDHDLELDNRTSLLDALRQHLGQTGAKKGCDHGQCGACTVLVDGRRANACLLLAVAVQGSRVTTVEGIAPTADELHPVQQAFLERDAYQCGYCTSGQICSAVGVLDEVRDGWPSHASDDLEAPPELSKAEVRERMAGNLCRCGAYVNIVDAVRDAGGAS